MSAGRKSSDADNGSQESLVAMNLGHSEVTTWYQNNVIPSITGAASPVMESGLTAAASIGLPQAIDTVPSDVDLLFPAFVDNLAVTESIAEQTGEARSAYDNGRIAVAGAILGSLAAEIVSSESVLPDGKLFLGDMTSFVSSQFAVESTDSIESFFLPDLATLIVVGSHSDDSIRLQHDPRDRNRIVARINGEFVRTEGATPLAADVQLVRVEGRAGDDHVNLSALRQYGGQIIARGGVGNDRIMGSPGDDILLGGAGRDLIIGGWGDDVIIGGLDADLLLGGFGLDWFLLDEDEDWLLGRRRDEQVN